MYIYSYNSFLCILAQVSDFKDQLLFSVGVRPEKIIEFSCGEKREEIE